MTLKTISLPLENNLPRPAFGRRRSALRHRATFGFTLVEMLIATALTLLLVAGVVQIFATVGQTAADTRAIIQAVDQVRLVRQTLQADLAGVTPEMAPPLDPDKGQGYFEIIEGPLGSRIFPSSFARVMSENNSPDTSVGDVDDVLMFTTATDGMPFGGKYLPFPGGVPVATTSEVAEVCYFVRGNVLYRRTLLVKPGLPLVTTPNALTPSNIYSLSSFYASNDISVRQVGGSYSFSANSGGPPTAPLLVPNSLGDLTKRQNRYGHQPWMFPYDARFWGALGLPSLRECSFNATIGTGVGSWPFPLYDPAFAATNAATMGMSLPANSKMPLIFPTAPSPPQTASTVPATLPVFPQVPYINLTQNDGGVFDAWTNPYAYDQQDLVNGALRGFTASDYASSANASNLRIAEDVILTNVISFDVKVWDPMAAVVASPGPDGLPGVAGFDDDYDGAVDNNSELGAGGSDDVVLQPGETDTTLNSLYPISASLPANTQYLQVYTAAFNNSAFSPTLPQIVRFGAYVDLCYAQNPQIGTSLVYPNSEFSGPGDIRSQLWGGNGMAAVYDTGCTSYEDDGLDQDAVLVAAGLAVTSYGPDQQTNQMDDNLCCGPDDTSGEPFIDTNGDGIYDASDTFTDLNLNGTYDPPETEAPPPYRTRLQGVQVRIRVFEPESRQVREVTVVQQFSNE